ncbi:hypothetical protein BAE44_0012665 [Dichanthelium oligosanthes]|uniref:TF-B3 domain-containing protein n=1 Tax=Dichanthelium oligosanthes TaxID=888268 RepID=A0A1E5VMG4_9POAL|nr:hypothetical protein BAE44_0012665 [Dichanthelium oligosanthes]
MAGDDKTPEAALEKVRRRRRSASSGPAARRLRSELWGDDLGRFCSSAPPPPSVAPSSAARKKERRPSTRGGAEQVQREEKPEDAKNGGRSARGRLLRWEDTEDGVGTPPAPSRVDEAAVAAASASSGREGPVDLAEKARILKGKMPAAVNKSPPRRSAYHDDEAPGSGVKLMGDAIRSHGGAAAARFNNKPGKPSPNSNMRKDLGPPFWYGMGTRGQSTSTAGSDVVHKFDKLRVVSDKLRIALRELGLDDDAPNRVYGKMMSVSDRDTNQGRLQMSCKSWRADPGEYPLAVSLTAAEKEAALGGEGLALQAYDRCGKKYELNYRYVDTNKSYRLTNNWRKFLVSNGLVASERGAKDVMLDLWLFRPPEGNVGMVMLHYRKGDGDHADAAFEEEERRTRAWGQDDDAAAEAPSPPEPDGGGGGGNGDAVMEDVAGDADGNKGEGGAKAAGEEQAGGAPSEAAAAPNLSPDADGTKMEEKEAGSAPMEAAVQSSQEAPMEAAARSSSLGAAVNKEEAGSQGGEEAAPPSSADAGGFKKKPTQIEVLAAHALVLLSQGIS